MWHEPSSNPWKPLAGWVAGRWALDDPRLASQAWQRLMRVVPGCPGERRVDCHMVRGHLALAWASSCRTEASWLALLAAPIGGAHLAHAQAVGLGVGRHTQDLGNAHHRLRAAGLAGYQIRAPLQQGMQQLEAAGRQPGRKAGRHKHIGLLTGARRLPHSCSGVAPLIWSCTSTPPLCSPCVQRVPLPPPPRPPPAPPRCHHR